MCSRLPDQGSIFIDRIRFLVDSISMASTQKKNDEGFLQKLFGDMFASSDSEVKKKRALKLVGKQISKSKYKFYKLQTKQVLPSFAKLFYDIYKIVSSAQMMFSNMQTSNVLKNAIIEYYMSDGQKEALARLSDDYITGCAEKTGVKELYAEVKKDIETLSIGFDNQKQAAIEILYNQFMTFTSFVSFDFFMLLKKFDPSLQERNFTTTPVFSPVKATSVIDDLKDFMTVAWALPPKTDWNILIKFVKSYKSVDLVPSGLWNKVIARLNSLKTERIFEDIISYTTENLDYKVPVAKATEKLIEVYISKLKTQTENILKKIATEKKNSKTDELLNQVFGTTDVVKLKNYVNTANEYFEKRNLPRYTLCNPLNYLKAFLNDYFKKDVRELSDFILVRGKWVSPELSNEMSNAYHSLLDISEKITAFDDSLGENVASGSKLKTLSSKAERDKEALHALQAGLKDVNNQAFTLITRASQYMIVYAKTLKRLIDEVDNPKPELMMNWQEIIHVSDGSVKPLMTGVYKKLYQFVSLLQIYIAEKKAS